MLSKLIIPVGTKYVTINGVDLPITGLAGTIQGQCFYPMLDPNGYPIKTMKLAGSAKRAQIEREKAERLEAVAATAGAPVEASDWK